MAAWLSVKLHLGSLVVLNFQTTQNIRYVITVWTVCFEAEVLGYHVKQIHAPSLSPAMRPWRVTMAIPDVIRRRQVSVPRCSRSLWGLITINHKALSPNLSKLRNQLQSHITTQVSLHHPDNSFLLDQSCKSFAEQNVAWNFASRR